MEEAIHSGRVLGGRYKLGELLGAGGWGSVYAAVQTDLGRPVGIKVLHASVALAPDGLVRFEREAKAAAALGHPNIAQVSDFQALPGEPPFLVMEMLTGQTLGATMRAAVKLLPSRVAWIAYQVLAGLDVAHRAGIIHRDIKPDNVFLPRAVGSAALRGGQRARAAARHHGAAAHSPARDRSLDRRRALGGGRARDAQGSCGSFRHRRGDARGPRAGGGSFGVFDIEASKAAIMARGGAIGACYAATEFDAPDHQFTNWTFQVDPAGNVKSVGRTTSFEPHAKLDVCMISALRSVKWPATPAGGSPQVSFTSRTRDNP